MNTVPRALRQPFVRDTALTLACVWFLAMGSGSAQERRTLSLHPAQGLRSADVTATGRAVAQYTTRVGSRLAAPIVSWGSNDKGDPLDVGMDVKKGQVLFSIDQSTFKARVEAAQAAYASAKAVLDNLVAPMRKERLDVLQAVVAELDARVKDREREEARSRQLVEVDRVQPIKKLEEVQLELEQARRQLKAAQARLDEALAGPTPTEIAIADAQVKEAQAVLDSAQLDLRNTVIVAPFDGVITRRMKGLGDYVAGAPFIEVLELTTLERLEAELRLPEPYLPQVVGGETRLTLHSPLMKVNQELVVTRVIPDIDPDRGTFVIRVAIPAQQRSGLVPGAFVTATLSLDGRDSGVVVPQRAVMNDGGKAYVMVADGAVMRLRTVELGDRLTEGVILKSGVRAGEQVLVGPAELLKDGAPLPDYLLEKNE